MAEEKRFKIVYCTPALYMAGGVERVLTLKANYFAEHFGYDITIILTEGKEKGLFYPLSDKVKIVNLDINFEKLWTCSFVKKVFVYLQKQRKYRKALKNELMRLRPDITVSLLRREINFISKIQDGSKKVGELHVNRNNYRNFEPGDTNFFKSFFSKVWMFFLVCHLKKLDRFVVLTEEDMHQWQELENVTVIPNPLTFLPVKVSSLKKKRVIAVGRYVYQKGFDLLLRAWSIVEKDYLEWELVVYGQGDRSVYEKLKGQLGIDGERCYLMESTMNIEMEYRDSSLFVLSSRFEGFGMVLIEAMACGLPVVSFDCPCGPKDIIKDGVDGLLVSNGNVEQLASSMSLLMGDEILREKMAASARQNVERFYLSNISESWKKLFEEVCMK